MDDTEIQQTVEAILGKGAKVVDCEKKSSIKEEEILLINGLPVTLEGPDGIIIKQALMTGQVPPCDLLNTILIKAGILRAPVKLETSLSVKSSIITKEEITVAKGGKVIDERHRETKEDNYYTSATSEVWEPAEILPSNELPECILNLSGHNTSTSNSNSSIPPKQNTNSTVHSSSTASCRNNDVYHSDTETSSYIDKQKYNSVCTDSSASSYDSTDEQNGSPILMKSNSLNKNGYLGSSISRDSGHDMSNSVNSMSSSTRIGSDNERLGCGNTFTPTSVSSLSSLDENDFISNLSTRFKTECDLQNGFSHQNIMLPTIFGTVASDHTPKDGANRRSLPQTPQGGKSFAALYSTSGDNGSNLNTENLSESELTTDNALVYRDGNLISGPLETLIQHMVPTNSYYPDRAYLFAFLLSSRLYIKPHELLARVCTLCCTQQQLPESFLLMPTEQSINTAVDSQPISPPAGFAEGHNDSGSLQFTTYLIQLLAEWTETFPYDFRDERVMQHVFNITQKCVQLNSSLRTNVSSLLQNLLQRLTTLENYEEFLQKLSTSEQEIDPTIDITEICPNPGILAQQLTHIELERLSYIGPEEFVQAFAKENPHLETSFKDMKKTRNLESYVQWFNRLSYFVATEVCKYPKKKLRVKIVEYWIETARECFNIGNFNSLMAIIAGLNMSPISRLKKTWSKIQSGKFSILEHQMDPSSNFSSYRSTLKAAMWRSAGARDERQRIVIPFFSLLVKDLYFLNEGCSNKLPNGHINFEKFWQLAKQVTEFMTWKQVTCPFEKNARVITLLQTSAVLSENALALASFECEPPENNQERERYKTLKTETNTS